MSDIKKNIAWVNGSYHFAYDILLKIKTKYSDSELIAIDEQSEFSHFYNTLITCSMFSASKLVIVSGLPEATEADKKHLKEALDSLPENTLVVFFMLDNNKNRSLYNYCQQHAKMYEFDYEIAVNNLDSYIQKRCKEIDICIAQEDIECLLANLQRTASNKTVYVDTIESALLRLVLLQPKKKIYDRNDILQTTISVQNFIIWDMINACDNKDFPKCINLFHDCVSTNYSSAAAFQEILNVLLWKFRMLLCLKEKLANKATQNDAVSFAASIRKLTFKGVAQNSKAEVSTIDSGPNKGKHATTWNESMCRQSMNSFYNRKPQLECYTRKELFVILECLQQSVIFLRSCKHDGQVYLLADILFSVICNHMQQEELSTLKKSVEKMCL